MLGAVGFPDRPLSRLRRASQKDCRGAKCDEQDSQPVSLQNLNYLSEIDKSQERCLRLDDHLERFLVGGVRKGLVGIEDLVEPEVMRDQTLGINLVERACRNPTP